MCLSGKADAVIHSVRQRARRPSPAQGNASCARACALGAARVRARRKQRVEKHDAESADLNEISISSEATIRARAGGSQ